MWKRWIIGAALLALLFTGSPDLMAKKPAPEPPPAAAPAIAWAYGLHSGGKLTVMDADGANETLVLDAGDAGVGRPDWSPDGTQLVFAGNIQGNGIYVINLDGTNLRKIASTTLTHTMVHPVWSPAAVPNLGGGKPRIAFVDQPSSGEYDLYLMDPDGGDRTRLTYSASPANEGESTWSPSATKLAVRVTSGTIGQSRWGLFDFAAGTYTVREFEGDLYRTSAWSPAWSKTQEDKIAWWIVPPGDEDGDIWVMDVSDPDGTSFVNLTQTTDRAERWPSWSPDDSKIVFWGSGGSGKLRKEAGFQVMNADGSDRRKIADGLGWPVWRR